jgi:V/A-type H+-transporting ATPase subunit A
MLRSVIDLPIREDIARMRYIEESDLENLDVLETAIKTELGKLSAAGGGLDDVA